MKLEEGKYYKTRDGRKVGPCVKYDEKSCYYRLNPKPYPYSSDGKYCSFVRLDNAVYQQDIIAEWQDGPIREVTKKELAPGVYGRFEIEKSKIAEDKIFVAPHLTSTTRLPGVQMTAKELREAAALFIELADYLDDQAV